MHHELRLSRRKQEKLVDFCDEFDFPSAPDDFHELSSIAFGSQTAEVWVNNLAHAHVKVNVLQNSAIFTDSTSAHDASKLKLNRWF